LEVSNFNHFNMKKSLALYLLVFCFSTELTWAQKQIPVNYYKPYEYNTDASPIVVKAWLDCRDLGEDFVIMLGEEEIAYTRTDAGTVDLLLPLFGNPGEISFYSRSGPNRQLISRQTFNPLVSPEWGHFGEGVIHIIHSSHQDVAWMNTPDSCREERIYDIVIPALDLMDKNPGFRFDMEQTLNLMEVLEEVPAEKERIIRAYKNGQFTWGATFNQPYEGLQSGEQLIRQTYLGRKWIKDNVPGMDAMVAYNIDVPGRSLQFPQILEKAGIKYLYISRMKEGFYNWFSPDGSKVLTFSPGNYGWSWYVYKYFEEDAITAMQKLNNVMLNRNDYYASRNIPPHYGISIMADAGGPRDYSSIINEWNAIAKNSGMKIPIVKHSTIEEFLGHIDVPGTKIDSIYGERPNLWLYIHGPAHYQAIKAQKAGAVSLPAAEAFSSINGVVRGDLSGYPAGEFHNGWYKLLYPDHGWGGYHGDITDSIFRVSLEEGNAIGEQILNESLAELSSQVNLENSNSILVFNDLSWTRDGISTVDISGKQGTDWIVTDTGGEMIPSRVRVEGDKKSLAFLAENIPSVGYKTFYLKNEANNQSVEVNAGSNFCENRFYSMELGPGGITRLVDKETGKNIFNTTKFAGGDLLSMGYDGHGAGEFVQVTPVNMHNYQTLRIDTRGNEFVSVNRGAWELTKNDPVSATFERIYPMRNFTVIQTITVFHQIKKIDFEYYIPDWPGEHNRQLRVAFPLNMNHSQITYDVPMGIVNVGSDELDFPPGAWAWGGTYRQMPAEINPREIQNFISASNPDMGVTISTNLAVADWIDPTREAADYTILQGVLISTHKSCHGLGNWYHQKGGHHFKLSLTSHQPGWENGYHFGVEGNHPLNSVLKVNPQEGALPEEMSFISVSSPFVRMTALKKSDDNNSLIIRLVEMQGVDEKFDLKLFVPAKSLQKTNLIEEVEYDTGQSGNVFNLRIGKNSIETYRLSIF
jgi:alpha-mannosidase